MSKDIRKWSDGRYTLMFDEHTFFVFDNEKEERMTALQVTKKLNEQQATINELKEENEQLKHYKLYEDNKRLQTIIADLKKENEQLKNRLNEEYIKECSIK